MSQTPRKIEDVIAELAQAHQDSVINLEDVPYDVRPGRAMAKQRAEEAAPLLEAELVSKTVPSRLVGVYASGDAAKITEAAAFLVENGGIVVDASKFYNEIAEYIEPSYGDRVFRTTQYLRLTSALRSAVADIGLDKKTEPVYAETICETQAQTVDHVRNLIRNVSGDEINLALLKKAIIDAVVERELTAKRIPALVLNATTPEQAGLSPLFSKTLEFNFKFDFEVTKDTVIKIFKGN